MGPISFNRVAQMLQRLANFGVSLDAFFGVIAGLDPAIHPHVSKMDPRVKPAGDGKNCREAPIWPAAGWS
jgi:hypothetical protein